MSISTINLGTSPTGTGGDTNRDAFTKTNTNFADLDLPTIVTKSAAFTLAASEHRAIIECNGTFNATLPNGLPIGANALIVNVGTGTITLAASTTLTSSGTKLASQYAFATVYHAGSNVWRASGDLTT